jgi:hypothetical protein
MECLQKPRTDWMVFVGVIIWKWGPRKPPQYGTDRMKCTKCIVMCLSTYVFEEMLRWLEYPLTELGVLALQYLILACKRPTGLISKCIICGLKLIAYSGSNQIARASQETVSTASVSFRRRLMMIDHHAASCEIQCMFLVRVTHDVESSLAEYQLPAYQFIIGGARNEKHVCASA